MKPTLSNKAFGRVRCQPRLAVGGLVGLLDELKLTGNLSVVDESQCFCLVLHIFHILEVELGQKKRSLNEAKGRIGTFKVRQLRTNRQLPAVTKSNKQDIS